MNLLGKDIQVENVNTGQVLNFRISKLGEVKALIGCAYTLIGYINKDTYYSIKSRIEDTGKMINSFAWFFRYKKSLPNNINFYLDGKLFNKQLQLFS